MHSIYKKLTAQDIGQVPFNANKQYNIHSSSFESQSISNFSSSSNYLWSSASIESFSSGAKDGVYPSLDTKNSLKYFQLEHLFYKDFKLSLNEKLGHVHYLKHKRELYNQVRTISIPNGLCGSRIEPLTFKIKGNTDIIDDSYGNLYVSSSTLSDYNTDIRTNVLRIGPEKGFKHYDLNIMNDEFEAGLFYRRGKQRLVSEPSYSKENIIDDSYFFNLLTYKNVTFSSQSLNGGDFSGINFNGTSSGIWIENDEKFHFNSGDDFTISLWANVKSGSPLSYLISKSTTKTIIPSTKSNRNFPINTQITGALQTIDVPSSPQFPFEIYYQNNAIYFSRSDGDATKTISSSFTAGTLQHVTCRVSSSQMKIFINGLGLGTSGSENFNRDTQNNANLYIGNKGEIANYLTGSLSQINIYDEALTNTQILNHYSSSNGSPYVGNIFYESGLVTITHPQYHSALNITDLQFQGSHLIYENEYKCTIEEHEFNYTLNPSARRNKNTNAQTLANFAISSSFKPYVTTVGLYNEAGELLVVGKLGQPTRMSDETDTTIVIRWDK
jgi:hypothetical protein